MTAAPEPTSPTRKHRVTFERAPLLPQRARWFLGLVMFLLPIAGLVFHAAVFLFQSTPWAAAYLHGLAIKIVLGAAFVTLVGNWFHYRYTRLTLDVYGRILIYCWLLSGLLLKLYWAKQIMATAA